MLLCFFSLLLRLFFFAFRLYLYLLYFFCCCFFHVLGLLRGTQGHLFGYYDKVERAFRVMGWRGAHRGLSFFSPFFLIHIHLGSLFFGHIASLPPPNQKAFPHLHTHVQEMGSEKERTNGVDLIGFGLFFLHSDSPLLRSSTSPKCAFLLDAKKNACCFSSSSSSSAGSAWLCGWIWNKKLIITLSPFVLLLLSCFDKARKKKKKRKKKKDGMFVFLLSTALHLLEYWETLLRWLQVLISPLASSSLLLFFFFFPSLVFILLMTPFFFATSSSSLLFCFFCLFLQLLHRTVHSMQMLRTAFSSVSSEWSCFNTAYGGCPARTGSVRPGLKGQRKRLLFSCILIFFFFLLHGPPLWDFWNVFVGPLFFTFA